MVHLNKNQLSKKQLAGLFNQLNATLGKLSSLQTNLFLSELLGYEERVMIAKRLACIVLLLEGKSLYKISRLLKISPSTAETLKKHIEIGQYEELISLLGKSKKQYFSILEALDSILHLGGILPHYNGLDRYKFLR